MMMEGMRTKNSKIANRGLRGLGVTKDPASPKSKMNNELMKGQEIRWKGEKNSMLDIHIHVDRVQPHSGTNGVTRSA